jgi:hypothetical protein
VKNPVSAIYCDCFQAFVGGERFFGEDTDRFLAKMLFGVSNVWNTYLEFFLHGSPCYCTDHLIGCVQI